MLEWLYEQGARLKTLATVAAKGAVTELYLGVYLGLYLGPSNSMSLPWKFFALLFCQTDPSRVIQLRLSEFDGELSVKLVHLNRAGRPSRGSPEVPVRFIKELAAYVEVACDGTA